MAASGFIRAARVLKVGLTGGYATGKSFVARELESLGCHLIYADELGHRVLEPDGEAYQAVVDMFGAEILDADRSINRKRLGELVFPSADLLEKLTGIVHPAVFRLETQMLAQFAASDPHGIAVVEAAILIETGRYRSYDCLILTGCSGELQIERGMRRDHLTREQVETRLAKQMSFDEKKHFASFVIDTSGSKEQTSEDVRRVFAELRALSGPIA